MNTADAARLYLDDCRYRQLSSKTIEGYIWALSKLPQTIPEDPGQVKRIIASQPDLSQESRHDLWRRLRTFYHWLSTEHQVADPMAHVPAPRTRRRLPRTLEPADIRRLLASADSRRDKAMLSLLLDTGIRLGELATLTWPAVTNSGLKVSGKTGERIVPISPAVRQQLVGLGDGLHIWTGKKGPLTTSGVQQAVRRCMYRAGLTPPRAGPHTLRHTFGRLYIMAGGDAFSLQRIMGHRNLATTMIYVYMSHEDLARQHAQFSPMANIYELPELREEEQAQ